MKFRVYDEQKQTYLTPEDFVMDGQGDFFLLQNLPYSGMALHPLSDYGYEGEWRYKIELATGFKYSDEGKTDIYEGDFVTAYKLRGEEYEGRITLINGEWWMWDKRLQEYYSKKLSDIPQNFKIKKINK